LDTCDYHRTFASPVSIVSGQISHLDFWMDANNIGDLATGLENQFLSVGDNHNSGVVKLQPLLGYERKDHRLTASNKGRNQCAPNGFQFLEDFLDTLQLV
jgi:hypothetical protein